MLSSCAELLFFSFTFILAQSQPLSKHSLQLLQIVRLVGEWAPFPPSTSPCSFHSTRRFFPLLLHFVFTFHIFRTPCFFFVDASFAACQLLRWSCLWQRSLRLRGALWRLCWMAFSASCCFTVHIPTSVAVDARPFQIMCAQLRCRCLEVMHISTVLTFGATTTEEILAGHTTSTTSSVSSGFSSTGRFSVGSHGHVGCRKVATSASRRSSCAPAVFSTTNRKSGEVVPRYRHLVPKIQVKSEVQGGGVEA